MSRAVRLTTGITGLSGWKKSAGWGGGSGVAGVAFASTGVGTGVSAAGSAPAEIMMLLKSPVTVPMEAGIQASVRTPVTSMRSHRLSVVRAVTLNVWFWNSDAARGP